MGWGEKQVQKGYGMASKNDLEQRTLEFAGAMIDFVASMPRGVAGEVIARQMLRSGSSVGANYREANRAESKADFLHKIGLCEKEASETDYWLQLCRARSIGQAGLNEWLLREAGELLAIFTAIGRKAKSGVRKANGGVFANRGR